MNKIVQGTSFLRGVEEFRPVTVARVRQLTWNTKYFEFAYGEGLLGLPLGQHLVMKAKVNGVLVARKYTPTTPVTQLHTFGLPIKIYYPTAQFPDGGFMTQYLDTLKEGDTVEIAGPRGKLIYTGNGQVQIEDKVLTVKRIGFVAGGTGITPCFQLIQHIAEQKEDVEVSLVYGNESEQDILLKDELDKSQVQTFHTLSHPPRGWTQGSGYFTEAMLQAHLPPPSPDTLICHCGSRPMNALTRPLLERLGYSNIFKF